LKDPESINCWDSPRDLPDSWENALFSGSSLYSISFLCHMKGTIPIGQSYFTAGEDSRFSGGIIISLPLKISRLGIRMNTALCRYPLSLPTRGYSSAGAPEMIFRAMETRREALKVIAFDGALPVNLPAGWIPKNGMPYAVFENSFSNFGEYVRSLRKNQRHSVLKSLKKMAGDQG